MQMHWPLLVGRGLCSLVVRLLTSRCHCICTLFDVFAAITSLPCIKSSWRAIKVPINLFCKRDIVYFKTVLHYEGQCIQKTFTLSIKATWCCGKPPDGQHTRHPLINRAVYEWAVTNTEILDAGYCVAFHYPFKVARPDLRPFNQDLISANYQLTS